MWFFNDCAPYQMPYSKHLKIYTCRSTWNILLYSESLPCATQSSSLCRNSGTLASRLHEQHRYSAAVLDL